MPRIRWEGKNSETFGMTNSIYIHTHTQRENVGDWGIEKESVRSIFISSVNIVVLFRLIGCDKCAHKMVNKLKRKTTRSIYTRFWHFPESIIFQHL